VGSFYFRETSWGDLGAFYYKQMNSIFDLALEPNNLQKRRNNPWNTYSRIYDSSLKPGLTIIAIARESLPGFHHQGNRMNGSVN
jgi:hypothetical protein